jgi:outer membrane protein assembly factor BamB
MNGQPVWTVALERQPGAPRLGGGSVMVGIEGGHLVVLDDASGRVRFETRTGGNVTGAPALDEKHIYEVGQDGVLRAFDRSNGAQRWYGNLATRASDGPFVDGDLVFVPLRTGAVDVRLSDGKAAVQLPAPGTDRLPMPPIVAGSGSSLSVMTVSYNLSDTSKWSLVRYATAPPLPTSARPATIPGFALTLSPPR